VKPNNIGYGFVTYLMASKELQSFDQTPATSVSYLPTVDARPYYIFMNQTMTAELLPEIWINRPAVQHTERTDGNAARHHGCWILKGSCTRILRAAPFKPKTSMGIRAVLCLPATFYRNSRHKDVLLVVGHNPASLRSNPSQVCLTRACT
jgi:hypothetical protein